MEKKGMSNKLEEVWVVTGASSGIGRVVVEKLVKNYGVWPSNIVCVGRSEDKLRRLRELEGGGGAMKGRLRLLPLDISNYDSNYYHLKKTLAGDKIKYLIANAGVCYRPQRFRERDFGSVVYEVNTNVLGTMSFVHGALKLWNSSNCGHISIISSPIGRVPVPKYGVYGATKAALINFAESLRDELREDDGGSKSNNRIAVSCLLPSLTNTEMVAGREKPSKYMYEIDADYVGGEIIRTVLSNSSGVRAIGLQAAAAMLAQRISPAINRVLL